MITLQDGTQHEIENGDVFYWVFKEYTNSGYHCKALKAMVINGVIKDLFWSQGKSDTSYTLDLVKVDLVFKGNINNYTEIREDDMKFYDDEDLLDISHSNHSNSWGGVHWLRNGATRSRQKVLELLVYKQDRAEYEIQKANRELKQIDELFVKLQDESFNLDEVWI